jgi:hypothetical protein
MTWYETVITICLLLVFYFSVYVSVNAWFGSSVYTEGMYVPGGRYTRKQ